MSIRPQVRRWALAALAATVTLAGTAGDASASGYANAVLADNPQLYWRLGESANTGTATDRAGHYDGTYASWNPATGASQPRTASPVPSALPTDPDGAQAFPINTYVETPPLPAFETGAIEFWMRNTATTHEAVPPGNSNIIWRGSGPPPETGYWSLSGGGFRCCASLSAPVFINGTIVDFGENVFQYGWLREEPLWHYYVARWTTTTIEIWQDGVLYHTTSTCCGGTSMAGERIRIGNVDHAGAATGSSWELDDVAVYTDLSPARIAAHYAARNAPTNLTPPVITAPDDGSGPVYRHDTSLNGSDGSWNGDSPVNYASQWFRCRPDGSLCAAIPGADGRTYVPTSADIGASLRYGVTARNVEGEDSAESAATPVIRPLKPEPQTPPTLSDSGSPRDGDTLIASNGVWGGDPADYYAFQWFRCNEQGGDCVPLANESSPAHRLTADDVDHLVRAQVTAVNASGSASQLSTPTGVIRAIPVANTRPPAISGVGRVGEVLSGDDGDWSGSNPRIQRNWLRCSTSCAQIPGATDTQYAITGQDLGFSLRLQIAASNSAGAATKTTESIGPIVGAGETPPVLVSTGQREPQPVNIVANPADTGPENGRNLAGQPSLSLQFATNQRAVDTIPFGETTYAGGRLVNERGEPIADASIALEERSAAGGDFHGLAEVITDRDGNYRTLIGAGPSRIVRASYRAHRLDRDAAATAQVQLAVVATGLLQAQRARLTLGDQAGFHGRLAGDPFPAAGIPVTLEAKDGPRWAQVARGRTSRSGQFAFRYRFCKTVRTYTYAFRVTVGQTAGWPYDPGTTNRVRVRVKVPRRVTRAIARRCR